MMWYNSAVKHLVVLVYSKLRGEVVADFVIGECTSLSV